MSHPTQVRDLVVEKELGSGGMATVYLARQSTTGRRVALKLAHPHLANDPTFVQRFLQEVKATSLLHHENVVEVVSCGEENGSYFIATEFIDGGDVGGLLEKLHKLPAMIATTFALQLLKGLGYAHERGIVHRDIKPANLMLTSAGLLKVCDFGIAKTQGAAALTQTGSLIGTPAYMSPEQAAGQPIDARSDLFSAGVVFYEMLTGVNPYLAENESTTLLRVLKSTPRMIFEVDPTVPTGVERILERLLERDPTARYASAAEAIAELEPEAAALGATPEAVAEFLRDPRGVAARLGARQSEVHLEEAKRCLEQGPAGRNQAGLALYRAVLLHPQNAEADTLLKQLCADGTLSFAASKNNKIKELEEVLEDNPTAGVLVQLASLYRLEGNLYKAVACFKRALKMRPNDGYVLGQLSVLTGQKPQELAPATATHGLAANRAATGGVRGLTGAARQPTAGARPATGAARPAAGGVGATGALPSFSDAAELHTGRTGEHAARRPTGPLAAPRPAGESGATPAAAELEASPTPLEFARAALRAYGFKLAAIVLVLVAASWFFKKVSKGIDQATVEGGQAMELLNKQAEHVAHEKVGGALERAEAAQADRFGDEAAGKLERARALARSGQHEEAAEACLAVMQDHPKRPQAAAAQLLRARSLGAAGKSLAGIDEIDAFLRDRPGHEQVPEALFVKAELQHGNGRFGEAIETATAFLAEYEASPHVGRVRLLRARSELQTGARDDARKDAEWVKGRYASSDPLYREAELILVELGDAPPRPPPSMPTPDVVGQDE